MGSGSALYLAITASINGASVKIALRPCEPQTAALLMPAYLASSALCMSRADCACDAHLQLGQLQRLQTLLTRNQLKCTWCTPAGYS